MTHQESCDAIVMLAPHTSKLLRYYRDSEGLQWYVKAWLPGGERRTFSTLQSIREALLARHVLDSRKLI